MIQGGPWNELEKDLFCSFLSALSSSVDTVGARLTKSLPFMLTTATISQTAAGKDEGSV